MLSAHNVGSAGGALHYFSQDNYYTASQGLEKSAWFGEGATRLGLSGNISKEDFLALLEGRIGDQQLGKWVIDKKSGKPIPDHRPGTDITFSAPKSVSILSEVFGQADIREAHEAAVKTALEYVEKNLAFTRQMVDGKIQDVPTGNLAVALFRHNTSRELDPQTHTHAVILNVTQRADGEWRSIANDAVYDNQRLIGAIYISALAEKIQSLGYSIERTDDNGNFEISGVSPEHIDAFSLRRKQIVDYLNSKGISFENATPAQKEQATLKTRSRKTDVNHEELIQSWKERAEEIGISLAHIYEQGKDEDKAQNSLTGRKAMEFAAAHLGEREIVNSKEDLLTTAIKYGSGRVGPTEILKAFDKLERNGDLVRLPDGQYATSKMIGSEQWALEQIKLEKGTVAPTISPEKAELAILDAQEKVRRSIGQRFTYSPGQRDALHLALTTSDRFVEVEGLAGVGKTAMLRSLVSLAEENGQVVRGMAPTGAAAKEMKRETGINAETVSLFMIKERQLEADIKFAKQYGDFDRRKETWIVDESSFVSQRQFATLLHMAERADAKIVYLGNFTQLQGVEAGKPFELAQKGGDIDTAYITQINRQKTAELRAAVDLIVGREELENGGKLSDVALKKNRQAFQYLDKNGMVHETADPIEDLVKKVVGLSPNDRDDTIVITAYNADRKAINKLIRHGLQRQGEISTNENAATILTNKGWTRAVTKEAQYYRKGDVVRFGRDYQTLGVGKGEYATVIDKDPKHGLVTLKKEDGGTLNWAPSKFNKVEVYDKEQRSIATGDRIRITRGDASSSIKNGSTAKVISVQDGIATIDLGGGEQHALDISKNKHWDYAYSSTVHAAQGATKYRTVFHIPIKIGENEHQTERAMRDMAKVFGDRSFYVGVTRATHELEIYTNNKERAEMAVSTHQDKTSAVEIIKQAEKQQQGDRRQFGLLH